MALGTFVVMYLDWRNNFLSVEEFAAHHGISVNTANQIINAGRSIALINL